MKQGRFERMRFLVVLGCAVFAGGAYGAGARLVAEESKSKEAAESEEEAPADDAGAECPPKPSRKLGIDEEYVRANLEKKLSPTTIDFGDDGRVRLTFDFEDKTEAHSDAFLPKISKKPNDVLRWTNRDDEYWSSSTYYSPPRDYEFMRGVKISNAGAAYLDLWFTDDVEAEICYVSGVNSSKKQVAAIVFTSDSKKSLGTDHGDQCVTFSSGKAQKVAKGERDPLPVHTLARFKLVVKNGYYEAWRDGKERAKAVYKKEDFASGRVGLIWSNVGSFVNRLEISGKLDYKKVAAELRKKK